VSTARIPILDVGVDPVTMVQTVELADRAIVTGNQTCIMAVNPEKVVAARRDLGLRRSLCAAEILIPDGIGVVIAGRRAGAAHMERVPGSELMPALCELAARRGYPVFLFGARPDTNAAACSNLRRRWPGLAIAGSHHGYIDDSETQALIERINASGARLLFVALGSPRQELWIDLHRGQLDVSVIQAVGEGRMDAVFALLGGLAGTAVFAHWHGTLIPMLYEPTNMGQITLTDGLGSRLAGVIVLAVLFGGGIALIGWAWKESPRV